MLSRSPIAIVLAVFVVYWPAGLLCVPLNELLPFGVDNGDMSLPMGSTAHVTVQLPVSFVFYRQQYEQMHISVNGLISFIEPVAQYFPDPFPLDTPLIAPFLADADTGGTGTVWYSITTAETTIGQMVADKVLKHFRDETFVPNTIVTITWDHVGYFPEQVDEVNTFQCALATNGSSSYVMFLYLDNGINWNWADSREGIPALVGFNKGCVGDISDDDLSSGDDDMIGSAMCGVYDVLEGSMTQAVVNVDDNSNIDEGSPGFYMWRVDSNTLIDGMTCTNNGMVDIMISPNYGHQFGGTPVIITGPCYKVTDLVHCQFGTSRLVEGVVINANKAMCVSPPTINTRPVAMELRLNDVAIATSTFSIVSYHDNAIVRKSDNNLLIRGGDSVTLKWDPAHFLSSAPSNDFMVNIAMTILSNPQYDNHTHWTNSSTLLIDALNNGMATINISTEPLLHLTDPLLQSPYAMVLFKISFNPSFSSSNPYVSALSDIEFQETSEQPGLYSHVMFLQVREEEGYCNEWNHTVSVLGDTLSAMLSDGCEDCFPSCPCNEEQAGIPNSGFVSLAISPGMSIVNQFLYPDATVCYTSVQSRSTLVYDPSQLCCYNDNGYLLVGMPKGGHQLAVSPLSLFKPWSHHFLFDISPYMGCCVPPSVNCQLYYTHWPSDNCDNFYPWTPGWLIGDPHMVTLDGLQYTFNGKGEFVLLETKDKSLTLKGRMTTLKEHSNGGTVFSSIAATIRESGEVIELRASQDSILVILNGARLQLSVGLLHYMSSFTVTIMDSGNVIVRFMNGVSLELVLEQEYFSSIIVSLSEAFANTTVGLLGNYDGDPSNDLLPSNSTHPLLTNSTLQNIHNTFGLSWIISNSSESLFTYDQSDSFSTYHHPTYTPLYDAVFSNSSLQELAQIQCQGNELCLFDIAATGSIDIGLNTLRESLRIDDIMDIRTPFTCYPACINGACVANDTCYCSYGYEGDSCDTPVYESCGNDYNPNCLNGGTCLSHLFQHTCSCMAGTSGRYCETSDCGELVSDSPVLSVSYNSTISGSVAEFTCSMGYNLIGNRYSQCLGNSSWSLHRPKCIIVDCGIPSSSNEHLSVSYMSTVFTAVSVYSCSVGYMLRRHLTRRCEASGEWSQQEPHCLIDCGVPPNWGYGVTVLYNDTVDGSVAVYECEDSALELFGPTTTTCHANGTWNEHVIECREPTDNSFLYIIIGSSIGGASVIFLLIVVIVTTIALILNRFRGTFGKNEIEMTEI